MSTSLIKDKQLNIYITVLVTTQGNNSNFLYSTHEQSENNTLHPWTKNYVAIYWLFNIIYDIK